MHRCKCRLGTKKCLCKGSNNKQKKQVGGCYTFAMATHEIPVEFDVQMTLSEMLVYAN